MIDTEQAIGTLKLKNKFIMAPVKTGYGTLKGEVTEHHIRYYQRRAEGGAAMLICEPFFIHPSGKELPTQIGINDDELIPGLLSLTDAVHKKGAKICAHINHAGRAANPKLTGEMLMAPSVVPCPVHGVAPKEMTPEDIEQTIAQFADAAWRAVQAGFDAVEIQFGLGYLAHQFLSPLTNKRQDEWAKPLRFSEAVIKAVRNRIGQDFPLLARISGIEFSEGGTTIEDALTLAEMLEQNEINALHVVNGSACDSPPVYYQFFALPEQQNVKASQRIKQTVSVPVIVTGRNGDPGEIRQLAESNSADFIGMGRPLVADPDLPNKMLSNQDDAVVRCGYCLQGCLLNVKALNGLKCVVNPEVGEINELHLTPSENPQKVTVIGGGPAGIKAALTADARGHKVELFEKEDHLGGQFALSFLAPAKKGMKILHDDLLHHLSQSSVSVHLNSEITTDKIQQMKPDSVILASGAKPKIFPFDGLETTEYRTGFDIYTFQNWQDVKKAVVIGGGLIGVEAAEFIAERKIETVLIEILPQIAGDMEMISRKLLMQRMTSLPVTIFTETKVEKIDGAHIHFTKDGHTGMITAVDLLVIATGTESVNAMLPELQETGLRTFTAGDAEKPAKIYEAIHSGSKAGMDV